MDDRRLDLPPGYTAFPLRERGDAFAHACAIAGKEGAGPSCTSAATTWSSSRRCWSPTSRSFRRVGHSSPACMRWPTPSRRIARPNARSRSAGRTRSCSTADWWAAGVSPGPKARRKIHSRLAGLGCILRSVDLSHVEAGFHAGATSLVAEGFDLVDVDLIAESFSRHLMTAFDLWNEKGFRAVGEQYLERLVKKKAGERRINTNGDLLTSLSGSGRPAGSLVIAGGARRGRVARPRRRCAEAGMSAMMLPRAIRLDPSDTFIFERAAEPGEWAVSGALLFAGCDPEAMGRRHAFRSGFWASARSAFRRTRPSVPQARRSARRLSPRWRTA